jgi:uncharacterized protein YjbJ (UPF0337 family)
MTRQRNTMKRRFATANRPPNSTSAAPREGLPSRPPGVLAHCAHEAACRRSRQGSHEESSRRFALKPFLEFSREKRRKQMKSSTKDQVKGKLHEMKGEVKEKAGKVTNNPNLTAEGQNEQLAGKVQKKVGQIEKVFET